MRANYGDTWPCPGVRDSFTEDMASGQKEKKSSSYEKEGHGREDREHNQAKRTVSTKALMRKIIQNIKMLLEDQCG